MAIWPGPISAITLFAEDLAATKQFYIEVFGLPVFYEDPNSAVFKFGDTLINLLDVGEAPELIEPGPRRRRRTPARASSSRSPSTTSTRCAPSSQSRGVTLHQRPDRPPMGHPHRLLRATPRGHIWEIAK